VPSDGAVPPAATVAAAISAGVAGIVLPGTTGGSAPAAARLSLAEPVGSAAASMTGTAELLPANLVAGESPARKPVAGKPVAGKPVAIESVSGLAATVVAAFVAFVAAAAVPTARTVVAQVVPAAAWAPAVADVRFAPPFCPALADLVVPARSVGAVPASVSGGAPPVEAGTEEVAGRAAAACVAAAGKPTGALSPSPSRRSANCGEPSVPR